MKSLFSLCLPLPMANQSIAHQALLFLPDKTQPIYELTLDRGVLAEIAATQACLNGAQHDMYSDLLHLSRDVLPDRRHTIGIDDSDVNDAVQCIVKRIENLAYTTLARS